MNFRAGLDAYAKGHFELALAEWRPLAERGDTVAQFGVAILFFHGKGVERDYVESLKWSILAARGGEASAATYCTRLRAQLPGPQVARAERLARDFRRTRCAGGTL